MEDNRNPRKNGPSRKSFKDVSTQTSEDDICRCPMPIPEICDLCGKRVLSVSSPNEISVDDVLPDNICQCFFSNNVDFPIEADFNNVLEETGEQNAELPSIQIDDLPDANLNPSNEYSPEASNKPKNDASSNEPKLLEYSFSSNGYPSSPGDFSFDPHLSYLQRRTSPISSDKGSKNSPNAEKSPKSKDHASSLHEQLFDQNVSDHEKNSSPISKRASENDANTEKDISSGYPSPGEQLSDDRKKSTSPSSGEDPKKNFDMENDETVKQNLYENNLEQLNVSECKLNESISTDRGEKSDQTRRECDYQYPSKVNRNANAYERSIPAEFPQFRFEHPRPVLPPPFSSSYPQYYPQQTVPHYQPHSNPTMNMSRHSLPHPQCHTQPIQSYVNPAMNMSRFPLSHPQRHAQPIQPLGNPAVRMPLNRTDIPGRFPVYSRPQMSSTPYRRCPDYDKNNNDLSMKLLLDEAEKDPEKSVKTVQRIEDWLENLPDDVPPIEEASVSGCASGWSPAENEEKEGIPPYLSEIFEELSSADISEEENRKQKSLKRPPRKHKK